MRRGASRAAAIGLGLRGRAGEPKRAVDELFMSFWDEVEPDWWDAWTGLQNRRTSQADHPVDAVVP